MDLKDILILTKANGDLGVSAIQEAVVALSPLDGSQTPLQPLGSLPDFELSELWLCPRFSAVDLGEVKSVRLKVDVHGVQQARRSALFGGDKNGKTNVCSWCAACFLPLSVLNSVADTFAKGRSSAATSPGHLLPDRSQGYRALSPGRHPPPLRLFHEQNIQSPLLPGTEQAH